VVASVGKGVGAALVASAADGDVDGKQRVAQQQERAWVKTRREEVTYGMRAGDMCGVVHGAQWERCARGETTGGRHTASGRRGCPMGCGVRCTLQHVVLGECRACEGAGMQMELREMEEALEELDEAIVDVKMVWDRAQGGKWVKGRVGEEEKKGRRGEEWEEQLGAARAALQGAKDGRVAGSAEWAAVRQVLAGVVPVPAAEGEWGEREVKRRARKAAEAVGRMQDAVHRTVRGWREATTKERGDYARRAETERWAAEQQRGWRVKRKMGGARAVRVDVRRADWEQVADVRSARWTAAGLEQGGRAGDRKGAGVTGGWEYFINP